MSLSNEGRILRGDTVIRKRRLSSAGQCRTVQDSVGQVETVQDRVRQLETIHDSVRQCRKGLMAFYQMSYDASLKKQSFN